MSDVVGLIPVFKKAGEVADWAAVDEDVFLWVKMRRWYWAGGYATTNFRLRNEEPTGEGRNRNRPMVRCYMHRELMRLGYGDKRVVDHINGDKLDNRLENLRVLTLGENGQNKPSFKNSTSQHRGVSWYAPRQQWRVQVMVNGRRTLVGYFDDEDEAGAAAQTFYLNNVPYRRQESVTATTRADLLGGTVSGPGMENSGKMEPHLVTVKNPK
jgi:hypothetical protein